MKPLKITIITNTIHRPISLVEKSVSFSLAQDLVGNVVLVDQNEKPLLLSESIRTNPKLSHQQVKVPAVSMARNRAIYPLDSDWLIFCDDDGYLDSEYLKKLLHEIQNHPGVEIFAGSIRRIDTGDFYSSRHAIGGDMNHFWNSKLLMGSNFAIKRSVFEKLGKFDEKFGAGALYGSSEETDLAWNAYFHGVQLKYAPDLVVHHVPPFEGELIPEMKKAYRYGVGKSALIRKWLFRGNWIVLMEAAEMFAVPIVRSIQFLVTLKLKELVIQLAAVLGRCVGLLKIIPHRELKR
jgi:GT2 family glycosyltransferase